MVKLLTRSKEYVRVVWRLENNTYSVSILEQVSKATGYRWQIGAIYVPLEKLRKKDHLKKYKGEPTAERRGRSELLYELTESNKNARKEIREAQVTVWEGVSNVSFD
jgi:PadR family transcriptional regulator PadR